ncbi:type II CAAX prenyl endopeptidase Rce1 family protein [Halobaculum litoreum]|uniref:Type II CAAX prenyl endopeptidase Rce1 family protein n=1 Tax=Halobaculum litoreum TaxID=3031998 RepID=A0ABD5XK73_9EURY
MNGYTRVRRAVADRPLGAFFVLTYAFTWALWIPLVGPLQGLLTFDVPLWALAGLLLGAFGPTVAAVAVLWLSDGRGAVRDLLARFGKWRVGWRWYAVAVLVWPAVFGATYAGYTLIRSVPVSVTPALLATLPLVYVVRFALAVPTGPLAEEAGWRGFALPELQARHGPLVASLVVGLAWALWHLPMFFVPGVALPATGTGDPVAILLYVVRTVGISIVFTWAYNGTGGASSSTSCSTPASTPGPTRSSPSSSRT